MNDQNTTALRLRGAVVARRGPRGITLIELLLALVLLVGMTAIVLPNLTPIWNEQSFSNGTDRLRDLLLLARAEAQSSGQPVEVRWDAESNQVTARRFIPALPRDVPIGESFTEEALDDPAADEETIIPGAWATLAIPTGVHLAPVRDDDGDGVHDDLAADDFAVDAPGGFFNMGGPDDFGSAPDDFAAFGAGAPDGPVSLALFLPDGSVVPGVAIMIADDHGRQMRCVLNQWTGLAHFEDASVAVEVAPTDDDTAEEEEDAFDEDAAGEPGEAGDSGESSGGAANPFGGVGERSGDSDDAAPEDEGGADGAGAADASDDEDDS